MSGLRRSLEACTLVMLCLPLQLGAETLGEMIDQTKSAKRIQQMGRAPAPVPAAPGKPVAPVMPTLPLLWSLSGMQDAYQAVLIYGTRAYTVKSEDADTWRVGPWLVTQIDDAGLLLTTRALRGKPAVRLRALEPGASPYPHYTRLTPSTASPPSAPMSPWKLESLSPAQMQAAQLPGATPPNVLSATPANPAAPAQ